jgi:hypothetical protein
VGVANNSTCCAYGTFEKNETGSASYCADVVPSDDNSECLYGESCVKGVCAWRDRNSVFEYPKVCCKSGSFTFDQDRLEYCKGAYDA